jgi:HEAT repeat protein
MKVAQRIATVFLFFSMVMAFVYAQNADDKRELSVEESYLQESVETIVIREQSRADSRDMKFIALEYIAEALKAGRSSEESLKALEYLSLEGVTSKSREGGVGRVTNNYPDVRAKSAEYMGDIGGEAAKNILIKVVLADPEPMVLSEAVKSLGRIGLNENEEVATAISWIVTRFSVLNPDNSLAFAALNAFDAIAAKNGGIKDPSTIRVIMKIADGPYIRPVQARAIEVLGKLRQYSAASSSKDTNAKKK